MATGSVLGGLARVIAVMVGAGAAVMAAVGQPAARQISSHHSGVPEVAFLVNVDGLVIYHNGDYRLDFQADFPYLQRHADRFDLAFVLGVSDETIQYGQQNRDLFERFKPGAVFPMHAEAGARMYQEFATAFRARIPGLSVMVPEKLGDRFEYRGGRISRVGT